MARAFIALGSNMGDRQAHLKLGCRRLAALPDTRLVEASLTYETQGVAPAEGKFLNAVAMLDTQLPAETLLQELQKIELEAGRPPKKIRPRGDTRNLDLDLLLYDEQIIDTPALTVPHPRMHERWFVLRPLVDLDPQARHPVLDKTSLEMLQDVERRVR